MVVDNVGRGEIGKWHLGEIEGRLPTDQGFDEWYGIPNTPDEALYSSQPGFDPEVVETPVIMESSSGLKPKHVTTYNLETRRSVDGEIPRNCTGQPDLGAASRDKADSDSIVRYEHSGAGLLTSSSSSSG